MATTIDAVVKRSFRELRGSRRETFNVLDEALAPGATTVKCRLDVGKISEGDFIGIGTEVMFVTEVTSGSNQLTVLRGMDGTSSAGTIPADTIIEVGWRWFSADMFVYVADEVRSWPTALFKPVPVEVTVGSTSRQVDVALTRFRYPLRLRYRRGTTPSTWVDVPRGSYRVESGLPTSDYANGNALTVPLGVTGSMILEYAQGFDLSELDDPTTDLVADVGLPETLIDAVMWGVAYRAVAPEEAGRVNRTSQPEPRIADEVKAGDALRGASAFKSLRDMRINEEIRRLRELYPIKF
jgi:hypothetical protein